MMFRVSKTLDGAGGVIGMGRIAARGPLFRSSFIYGTKTIIIMSFFYHVVLISMVTNHVIILVP